ncbi:pyrroloquinoline quinone biosynthesis protein PqqC [Candidatus Peribacteria bacterium]|jgi:pyrroloquinoline-quinone synthase|nr:pyrroloquinoline quinone biosynthesis protein PqqC [Candidatus Peribacteria bacterium]MBT4021508.1 pyrroloquinoline quinone biosynthesis protein PqqC [Candidatus Peribacteria bacterium]MBT4240986.1 pyrroloquinoline quinone biosynthesis protein PqqC [Candidatus Peribacteria bacterium]MBT4473979.1 pyrroloquinoline quinone biosynthesis protein PqqC [Candidatus Peribacteria bacterium]
MFKSLKELDEYIHENSLLTHFFYEQKWSKGELTLDDLATYAKEYYFLVKNVPTIVLIVLEHARKNEPGMVLAIEENLSEEQEHIELWERFANTLGVSKEELESYIPYEKTKAAIEKLKSTAMQNFQNGMAVIYSLELSLPEIAKTKKDGLCKYYKLDSEDSHIYFDEHLNEEKHLAVWRKALDPLVIRESVEKSLKAQHLLLDGVCEACGIF